MQYISQSETIIHSRSTDLRILQDVCVCVRALSPYEVRSEKERKVYKACYHSKEQEINEKGEKEKGMLLRGCPSLLYVAAWVSYRDPSISTSDNSPDEETRRVGRPGVPEIGWERITCQPAVRIYSRKCLDCNCW